MNFVDLNKSDFMASLKWYTITLIVLTARDSGHTKMIT